MAPRRPDVPGVGGSPDGTLATVVRSMDQVRREAIDRMAAECAALSGHGVVGVRLTSSVSSSYTSEYLEVHCDRHGGARVRCSVAGSSLYGGPERALGLRAADHEGLGARRACPRPGDRRPARRRDDLAVRAEHRDRRHHPPHQRHPARRPAETESEVSPRWRRRRRGHVGGPGDPRAGVPESHAATTASRRPRSRAPRSPASALPARPTGLSALTIMPLGDRRPSALQAVQAVQAGTSVTDCETQQLGNDHPHDIRVSAQVQHLQRPRMMAS